VRGRGSYGRPEDGQTSPVEMNAEAPPGRADEKRVTPIATQKTGEASQQQWMLGCARSREKQARKRSGGWEWLTGRLGGRKVKSLGGGHRGTKRLRGQVGCQRDLEVEM
jgi:hypothetical protein